MSNEIAVNDNAVYNTIDRLNSGSPALYSSFKGDDFESNKAQIQALTNSQPVADHLGKKIALTNVIVQSADMVNEKSGEVQSVPRITLVDKDGNSFHTISGPLMRDLENVIGMMGDPASWPQPLDVSVTEEKGNGGYKFFKLSVV